MSQSFEFNPLDSNWSHVFSIRAWSLYIYGGGLPEEKERRCSIGYEKLNTIVSLSIGISRSKPSRHANFQLQCGDKSYPSVTWSGLASAISKCLAERDISEPNIILDLTSLDLDTLLYLLPQVRLVKPSSLYGLYLVPDQYAMRERGLVYQSIQQPKGYVSFQPGLEGGRYAHHYIIAGFDQSRAQRYIENFDWGWKSLHAVIGKPAYVKNGFDIAWEANSEWLKKLKNSNPNNIHEIDAKDPTLIKGFFQKEFGKHGMLDIVPIGPKPMLLGVLFFYFSLSEVDRNKVRILFDFPAPKPGFTEGVSTSYLFNCKELLPN